MKKIKAGNKAVTPVISVLLITAAIFTAAGVVWFGVYSEVGSNPNLDASLEYDQKNQTHMKITIEHIKNVDELEIYYYESHNFESPPQEISPNTNFAPGDQVIHENEGIGAYRIIGYRDGSTQTISNVRLVE